MRRCRLSLRLLAAGFGFCLLAAGTLSPARGQAPQTYPNGTSASGAPATGVPAHRPLPIKTGTASSGVEAGETNDEMEQYTHSSTVAAIGHRLGLTTNQASRYMEDLNSGVLILIILYFVFKIVPGKFRAKREGITRDLANARKETADAQQRLAAIEQRLAALGTEVDALRSQAAASGEQEEVRIHAALEEERQRIVRSSQAEIAAAQANAERGLKRFASDLAVDRAAQRLRLTPEGDRALVDEFLEGLAGSHGLQGKN